MSGAYFYWPNTPSSRQQRQICHFYFCLISGIGSTSSEECCAFVMLSGSPIGQPAMFTFSYDGLSYILANMSQYNCYKSNIPPYRHPVMPCKLTASHIVDSCASISTVSLEHM